MGKKEHELRRLAKQHRRNQRIILFLTLGGVFLVAAGFLLVRGNQNPKTLTAIAVHGAPSLKLDKENVDLGNVQLGQTVKVSFNLTNVGDQPLRFSAQPYVEVVEGC